MSNNRHRRLLAEAAVAVGINLNQLGADEHPWNSDHPMVRAWQMAVKEISPSVGEEMEVEHGAPLSMALAMALDGDTPLTQDLLGEWQSKRPQQFREYKQQSIDAALERMREQTEASAAANSAEAQAERQSALQNAVAASRQQAERQLRQQAGF